MFDGCDVCLLYLSLHHRRPLCAQHFDGLEDVDGALVTHPLQHDTESDEHTCAPDARTDTERERRTLSVCVCVYSVTVISADTSVMAISLVLVESKYHHHLQCTVIGPS